MVITQMTSSLCNILTMDSQILDRFNGFKHLSADTRSFLLGRAKLSRCAAGEVIFKARPDARQASFYLISGVVELRFSFERRIKVSADDELNDCSLQDRLGQSGSIRAVEACELIEIASYDIESAAESTGYYNVVEFSSVNALLDMEEVTDNYQSDWQLEFLKGAMAKNVPSRVIHQLFSALETVCYQAGDIVMKSKTPGDFFYIVKEGEVCIKTEEDGSFNGQHFLLGAGQYFGDEALVADTVRNATAVMATDGSLGRLDKAAFLSLIKPCLVKEISREGWGNGAAKSLKVIDIRYPIEIPRGETLEGRNIPINHLRKELQHLKRGDSYMVLPASDIRSELAAYLLRQHGLDAYLAARSQ